MADEGKKNKTGTANPQSSTSGQAELPPWIHFRQLITQEFTHLNPENPPAPVSAAENDEKDKRFGRPGPADEPWVVFTPYDHFGIALSGGGIRSATFNLGLLQGLNKRGVLDHVDYLSTVSGGGYTGGFWTAWRYRRHADDASKDDRTIFPPQVPKNDDTHNPADLREGPEIRHLREFSRFLMPRVGFTCSETWSAIATIISGMLPSLSMTLALTGLFIYVWLGANYCLIKDPTDFLSRWFGAGSFLAHHGHFAGLIGFVSFTVVFQWALEQAWRKGGKAGNAVAGWSAYIFWLAITAAITGICWWVWSDHWLKRESVPGLLQGLSDWSGGNSWPGEKYEFSPLFFGPAVAWSLAGAVLMLIRLLTSGFGAPKKAFVVMNYLDRCIYRCLAPALVCALAALSWELCRWLGIHFAASSRAGGGAGGGFVLTAVLGALFAWLRSWLAQPVSETNQSQLLHKVALMIKPWIPQLLAVATVVVFILSVTLFIQDKGLADKATAFLGLMVCLSVVVLLLWLFDPARVGLHNFYRERIARCYLGAARTQEATANRQTSEQSGDDLTFKQLRDFLEYQDDPKKTKAENDRERKFRRPIHLVCCAANDIFGDSLGTLSRGARSAVLSPHGISLGNHTKRLDELDFSSALTASAAAFNSQMGQLSMQLGPAVAIVMSALNLRLGLWVPHPLRLEPRWPWKSKAKTEPSPEAATQPKVEKKPEPTPPKWHRRYHLPGWLFLCEMFGLTKCDAVPDTSTATGWRKPVHKLQALMHNLHLSDGGHFENLALYELVRRHCRYVIVSDCGADPEVAFDDLANVLRRVREDFGVEIDLNVEPLRPGPGNRSIQHAVIGTIHYDGLGGTDKGTILYFKPTLTGDEPPDTIQYQTRNPAFPHETTADQFYDEAQWEAYRRLGEHQAGLVLPFSPKKSHPNISFVENLFLEASHRWHPTPPRQSEVFLELTGRCSDLEKDMRESAPAAMQFEFFPELAASGLADKPATDKKDEIRIIYFLMIAIQIMEDTWVGAELDIYWSHPLNEGWMHYFQRWASMPSFRRWWPILRPLYSSGFADFVKARFNLRLVDQNAGGDWAGPAARLQLSAAMTHAEAAKGLAWQSWVERFGEPSYKDKTIFDYRLTLNNPTATTPVQVGFLLFQELTEGARKIVEWRTSHLFVPHSLIGGGIIAKFLDAIIDRFINQAGLAEIRVILDDREEGDKGQAATKGKEANGHQFRPDLASRQQLVHTINFYKSRFFTYQPPDGDGKIHKLVYDVALAHPKRKKSAKVASP